MSKEDLWAVFAARHAQSVYEAAERRERVYRENPALFVMDQAITAAGARCCAAMARGGQAEAEQKELAALEQKRTDFLNAIHADFEPHYSCPLCEDTGMGPDGPCACFKRALIEENFRESNIGQHTKGQSFEQFDLSLFDTAPRDGLRSPQDNMEHLLRLCRGFVEEFRKQERGLLFVGDTGLGKTFLSTAIARALLEKGYSVIYISAPEFARRVENLRFRDEDNQLEQLAVADMLIIDDLGTESRTPYTIATLTDLIDRRIRAVKPMLFSTNLNLEGLQRAYDERIVSRLLGHFTYCFFYGDDLRLRDLRPES